MTGFVIIEDQQMVCEMLAEFIGKTMPGFQLSGCALDSKGGLALCRRVRPQLVLLDIHIQGADGIETGQAIVNELPETHVILISGDCSPYNCYRISESGIRGFVDKMQPLSELNEAIEQVMAGGSWFSASYEKTRRSFGKNPNAFFKILSAREQEVLLKVARGDNDDEIARHLNISRRTAETHRYNITKKLGLSDTSALRKYAIELGMWSPQ
ncbi:response regulator transcription factor [Tichowtungia aerotolerans]|uniref:Response regulator n=1 Tax=Tichowtungia aerotolerans TaxID=2697043 RepID=A0A6P1M4G3_9BACT|nr:response regulator transcription factor [Tichowtungia aerotolerans]QHI68942.1 response regulator [Tichowtungia aerotolerans]